MARFRSKASVPKGRPTQSPPDLDEFEAVLRLLTGRPGLPDKVPEIVTELYRLVLTLQVACPSMRVHLHMSGSTRDGAQWLPLIDDAVLADENAMHVLTSLYNFIHAESSMVYSTERLSTRRKRRAVCGGAASTGPGMEVDTESDKSGGDGSSPAPAQPRTDFETTRREGLVDSGEEAAASVPGEVVSPTAAATDGAATVPPNAAGADIDAASAAPAPNASTGLVAVASANMSATVEPGWLVPRDATCEALEELLNESSGVMGVLSDCMAEVRSALCGEYDVSLNKASTIVHFLKWWPCQPVPGKRSKPLPFGVRVPIRLVPVTSRRLDLSQEGTKDVFLDAPWPARGSPREAWVATFLLLYEKSHQARVTISIVTAKAKTVNRIGGMSSSVKKHGNYLASSIDDGSSGKVSGCGDGGALVSEIPTGNLEGAYGEGSEEGLGGGDSTDEKLRCEMGGGAVSDGDAAMSDVIVAGSGVTVEKEGASVTDQPAAAEVAVNGASAADKEMSIGGDASAVNGAAGRGGAAATAGAGPPPSVAEKDDDASRAQVLARLQAMRAARMQAAVQQKQIQQGLLKVGAKPKVVVYNAGNDDATAATKRPSGRAGKKALKQRHPRDVRKDVVARAAADREKADAERDAKREVDGSAAKSAASAKAKRARVVHVSRAEAPNDDGKSETTITFISTKLKNVHVYDVDVRQQLDNVRDSVASFGVKRDRSAALPSISSMCSTLHGMKQKDFEKKWKMPALVARSYVFKLCLLTASEYKTVVDAQSNIYTLLTKEQVTEAEVVLQTGSQSIATIDVDQPSSFCLEARSSEYKDEIFYLTSATIADMLALHRAASYKSVLLKNSQFVLRTSKMHTVGTAMELSTGEDAEDVALDVLGSLLDTPVSEEVFKPFTPVGALEQLPYCPVFSSDLRNALMEEFMTDAILDANLVVLREWCSINNKAFYPLLCQQASSVIGHTDYDVSLPAAIKNIELIARSVSACCATKYGFLINIKQRHWIGAVVDVVDHKVIFYDSMPGLKETEAAMPNVLSRLKLFGAMMRDASKRLERDRPAKKVFHKKTVKLPRQSDGYNCGPFAFSRLFHSAHSTSPTLRGNFGDAVRLAMVHNVFASGEQYRRARRAVEEDAAKVGEKGEPKGGEQGKPKGAEQGEPQGDV